MAPGAIGDMIGADAQVADGEVLHAHERWGTRGSSPRHWVPMPERRLGDILISANLRLCRL